MSSKDDEAMIELALEDVALPMGENIKFLDECLSTIFCRQCSPKRTRLTHYRLCLNNLEDLIFKGECTSCGSRVARYIETGENLEMATAGVRPIPLEYAPEKGRPWNRATGGYYLDYIKCLIT